jgi:SAM-dependent methyltransferase
MEITSHDRLYWQYEYNVASQCLVPLLTEWNIRLEGATLLDVGCGDGGGLSAFYDAGMVCKGFDIEQRRVDLARALAHERSLEVTAGNLYEHPLPFVGETFDLIVLHDVFEHLERKTQALRILREYLTLEGRVLITFPPYYSAFGAHQQLLRSRLRKIPFIHLMPLGMSKIIPSLQGEHGPFLEEIKKLGRMRMGITQFERLVLTGGFVIERKKFYLVGPNHIRFGWKPVSAGLLGMIPLVREVLVSGAIFLLKPTATRS